MTYQIAVVAEDRLTEAVLHKCISEFLPKFTILRSEVKNGRGNIQRNISAYANLSRVIPVLIGVDLDDNTCAPQLLDSWNVSQSQQKNLLLRVAIREIEAWVLGDKKQYARFIKGQSDDITSSPDDLNDPKLFLLELARKTAPDELKADLLPVNFNKKPRIGKAYNLRMCEFVTNKWRPHVARENSPSLNRAIIAIERINAS